MDKLEFFMKFFGFNDDTYIKACVTQLKNKIFTFNEDDTLNESNIKIENSSRYLQYSKKNYVWIFKRNDGPKLELLLNIGSFSKPLVSNPSSGFDSLFSNLNKLRKLPLYKPSFVNGYYSQQLKMDTMRMRDQKAYKVNEKIYLYPVMHTRYRSFKSFATDIFKRSHMLDLLTLYKKCCFPMQRRNILFHQILTSDSKLNFSNSYFKFITKNRLSNELIYKSVWNPIDKRIMNKSDNCNSVIPCEDITDENLPEQTISTIINIKHKVQNLRLKLIDDMEKKERNHDIFLEECHRICSSTDSSSLADVAESYMIDDAEMDEDSDTERETENDFMQSQLASINCSQGDQPKYRFESYFTNIKSLVTQIPDFFITSCLYLANMGVRMVTRFSGREAFIFCCF